MRKLKLMGATDALHTHSVTGGGASHSIFFIESKSLKLG